MLSTIKCNNNCMVIFQSTEKNWWTKIILRLLPWKPEINFKTHIV